MLLHPPQLISDLVNSTLFLDTNVFVVGSRSEELLELLAKLRNDARCDFTSIPSVLFEFVRGSQTISDYNENVEFYNEIVSHTQPEKIFSDADFSVVMAKVNAKNKSYTDFLLAAALYSYRNSGNVYLLSTDIKMFPEFFDMTHLITVCEDRSHEIRNFGVFKFNSTNYAKAAKNIIESA